MLAIVGQAAHLGLDLQGDQIERLTQPDSRVLVLFFAASDCPISNRYVPEIIRLRKKFSASEVAFWWVFPNHGDTSGVVREYERQFSIDGNTVLDTEQNLVRLAHVTATPEAAVFRVTKSSLQQVYHGAVDDRYLSLGKERPLASKHFLEDAISASLEDRAISPSVIRPVGCAIIPVASVR